MSEIAGYDLTPDSCTTLRKVLNQNLSPFLEQFESISAAATKVRASAVALLRSVDHVGPDVCVCLQEFSMEKAMQTMVNVWAGVSFHHQPYKESGVSILCAVDEIQTMLEDQIVKTQTMMASPFIKPLEKEIKVSVTKGASVNGGLTETDSLLCPPGMGGVSAPYPGDHRRVAEGAGAVALPGARLLLPGHHAPDPRRRPTLPDRRQEL